ncbi:Hsp20/alpha crystallin family protein [Clostridium weizhouense]|uniref:Hsp20/alpha crystallin family protein n=1 Tax=Clostridium weizhouense TaxID=2859781 RepID=A0ABS7AQ89_9CLOT|nr:Hsp20/alpha crystallin family protein [Clostridium weizhouense]MBW6410719.1 Hsp20/alpha crystallin family protein [Clostridium weizhouense]
MKVNTNLNNSVSKMHLSPISSNISFGGTTVSYGIRGEGGSSINAFNNQTLASGNWGNNCGNWGNGQLTNQWQQSQEMYPTISASNYNQSNSGMYHHGNQYGNQFSNQNCQLNYVRRFTQGQSLQPTVDISETSNDIVISAYVSNGIMDDISLNVSEDSVTISGSVWNGNDGIALRRIIPLSTTVRAEACDASLQSGMLEIRLPKTEKMNRTRPTLSNDSSNIK